MSKQENARGQIRSKWDTSCTFIILRWMPKGNYVSIGY